jgi:superfamily II DNA or RNA helicase
VPNSPVSPLDGGPLSLDALASPGVVRRGRDYARRGNVLDWRARGDRFEARVQGLEREPYLVALEWDGEEILPSCTCPYDREPFCKHSIAALTAAFGGPLARGLETDDGETRERPLPRRAAELAVRRDRGARTGDDGFSVKSLDGERYFGHFEVTSPSRRVYRVEIRSHRHLNNACGCHDFQTNMLGTCKHVEAVLQTLRRRAPRVTARLAQSPPPTTFILVRRLDEPRLWVQRGGKLTKRLAGKIDHHFEIDGAFRGDPVDDFPALVREIGNARGIVICDDAREFVERSREEAQERARRAATVRRVLDAGAKLPGVRAELYPYQTHGVAFLASTRRALLADDMGLGKTLQALAACRWLMDDADMSRVLIVCPASLKHQWKREIDRFLAMDSQVIQGGVPIRREQYRRRAPFTIVNYELVLRDGERIRELDPDILVLDEAQRIKNWRTKTADAVKSIRSRHAFVLTGTPIENRLDDLYSLLQVVDRRVLGPLWSFNERFLILEENGRRAVGHRNLKELRRIIRPVFLRRDRAHVLSQLPDRVDNRFDVPLTATQREIMDEHVQAAAMLLARARRRPLTLAEQRRLMAAMTQARMACNAAGLVDKETRGSPKLDEFARVLEEVCQDDTCKVVVFSEWEGMIRFAAERAKRLGIGYLVLSGRVPTAKRGALLDRFRGDPEARVLFSTDAGGVGLNLQAAQTVINLDLPWNPARLEQRIGRVHRLGQPRSVNVILMIAERSIESHIETVLEKKRDLFDSVVSEEGGADEVRSQNRTLHLVDAIVSEMEEEGRSRPPIPGRDDGKPEEPPTTPVLPEPAAVKSPEGSEVEGIEDALGYRLRGILRLRSGRLVVQVDCRDEEIDQAVRAAAGGDAMIVDVAEEETVRAFGEDSPLAGAEVLVEVRRTSATPLNGRTRELRRVADRKLAAAVKLREAGLDAEALVQAHTAMLTGLDAVLPPEIGTGDPDAVVRATYEHLLPAGRLDLEQIGALGRVADLCRAFANRDLPVPEGLAGPAIADAEGLLRRLAEE